MQTQYRRGPNFGHKVFRILEKNVGLPCHVDDIAKEVGVSRKQVLDRLSQFRRDGWDLETVSAGHIYRLASLARHDGATIGHTPVEVPQPGKMVFQEVGTMRDGTLVIQGDDDQLYKAELL